jgi:hypothetical protein
MHVHPPTQDSIEVRGFKLPRRPTSVALASSLGEDQYGHWLGLRKGSPWWAADGFNSGTFSHSFVKLVPSNTFWSVCFHPGELVVDVDIILPVTRKGHILEEIDLELDVLRSRDGKVWIRDQDTFERLQIHGGLPLDIATKAMATCQQIHAFVEQSVEPFGSVGISWLTGFLQQTDTN